MAMDPALAQAIIASSARLGIDPVDLATSISYETGGKLSPSIYGGAGGKYLGLIQFSPENQKKYGVKPDQSAPEQMQAVESYLRDRGVRPGMGLADVYSAINAGSPGRYNASDANNGGAPGTVMDKVTGQMAGHRANAIRLLGADAGMIPQAMPQTPNTIAAPPTAGATTPATPAVSAPADNGTAALMAQLQNIPKMLQAQQASQQFAPTAPVPNNLQARMAAIAAARQLGQPS